MDPVCTKQLGGYRNAVSILPPPLDSGMFNFIKREFSNDSDLDNICMTYEESESSKEEFGNVKKEALSTKDEKELEEQEKPFGQQNPLEQEKAQEQGGYPQKIEKKWARKARKERSERRNSGKAYVTSSGKYIAGREIKPLKDCRKNCKSFLTSEIQRTIFKEYWNLGSRLKRVAFIVSHVNIKEKAVTRKRKTDSCKTREITYEYFLPISEVKRNVCKDCFCKTLSENEKFIRYALTGLYRSEKIW